MRVCVCQDGLERILGRCSNLISCARAGASGRLHIRIVLLFDEFVLCNSCNQMYDSFDQEYVMQTAASAGLAQPMISA